MRLIFATLISVLCMICPTQGLAGVYHCVNSAGVTEFSDRPCAPGSEKENFLPYTYQSTNPKTVQAQEKEVQNLQKKVKAETRKELQARKRDQKEAEKKAVKVKRREARCLKAEENIKNIQEQLRLGCKLHQGNRLRAKLKTYEAAKRRYCGLGG